MCQANIQLEVKWRFPWPTGRAEGGAEDRHLDNGRFAPAAGEEHRGEGRAFAGGGGRGARLRGGGIADVGMLMIMNPNNAADPRGLQVGGEEGLLGGRGRVEEGRVAFRWGPLPVSWGPGVYLTADAGIDRKSPTHLFSQMLGLLDHQREVQEMLRDMPQILPPDANLAAMIEVHYMLEFAHPDS